MSIQALTERSKLLSNEILRFKNLVVSLTLQLEDAKRNQYLHEGHLNELNLHLQEAVKAEGQRKLDEARKQAEDLKAKDKAKKEQEQPEPKGEEGAN